MKKVLRKLNILLLIFALAFALFGCEKVPSTDQDGNKVDEHIDPLEQRVEEILNGMTLEEKVGQLFILKPEQLKSDRKTVLKADQEILDYIEKYHIGGVILFAANIKDEEQLLSLNSAFKEASDIPLFIATDEEGGSISRLKGKGLKEYVETKDMYDLGKGDGTEVKEAYTTIANYLRYYGFNTDFAPICDTFTNPKNTVIGKRAFSYNQEIASKMAGIAIDALHDEGIIESIKHFPGHGDTSQDTHYGTVSVKKTWSEMKKVELIPFIDNLDRTDMVMASHILCENIDKDYPTSLSEIMITEKLRGELGYDGVVISDSFKMSAVAGIYTSETVARLAINAGVDIILMPNNFEKSYNEIIRLVETNEISEERIDESVRRILRLKVKYLDA